MDMDYRCYFKCRNSDIWRKIMETIAIEASDEVEYNLLEISKVFNTMDGMKKIFEPIGEIFDTVTAVEKESFCFIHDHRKSYDFFVRLTEYILGEIVGIAKNEVFLIADITDFSTDAMGDHLFYYCGGDNTDLIHGVVEEYKGLEHHEIEISNVKEMLKYEPLSVEQKAYIDRLVGDTYPKTLMDPMRFGFF